jgi:thioredoxin-related protein
MKRIVWCFVVVFLVSCGVLVEDGAWGTDFAKARKTAAKTKLPIYAIFTGSDWCPWCRRLSGEVLSTDEFKTYAKGNLVLFVADFPRNKELPGKTAKQNQELADKYHVEGFPTVLLLDADGKELARTGYRPGGAMKYIEYIKGLLSKQKQSTENKGNQSPVH